jgi:zinc-ribbon domain
MFCPTCGKENSIARKFCVACGTNLEAVSQALSGNKTDFFTRTDLALDQLIAKYAEHVFKDSPANTANTTIGKSWKILGQGVLTALIDMVIFTLMMNIFPLRFLILLISSPFRLLNERNNRQNLARAEIEEPKEFTLPAQQTNEKLPESPASVTENTTERLKEFLQQEQRQIRKTPK